MHGLTDACPMMTLFPSPFGVRVLKFHRNACFPHRACGVSVPFRGSCSEIYPFIQVFCKSLYWFPSPFGVRVLKLHDEADGCSFEKCVSVPFRGSCSEIFDKRIGVVKMKMFPSPFGVRVLKLPFVPSRLRNSIREFPSPFGVRVLK